MNVFSNSRVSHYRMCLLLVFVFHVASATSVCAAPLKIGAILPLSGDFAYFGQQARQGIEVAVAHAKRDGIEVEVIFEDDRCLPKDALTAYKKLTSVDRVEYIVGPACTGSIMAAGAAAQAERKFMLALLDTNKPVARIGEYVYALGYSSEEEAEIVADYMSKVGIKRVGVIVEDDAWALNIRDAFVKRFLENGGIISSDESQLITNAVSAPDYKGVIVKSIQKKPEALYVVPAYNGGYFLKQLRSMGQKIPVYGPDTFAISEAFEVAGEHANGVICANAVVDEQSPQVAALKTELTSRYGSAPSSLFYTALGYDGVRMLLNAVRSGKPFIDAMRSLGYSDGALQVREFNSERLGKLSPGLFVIREHKALPLRP